MHNTNEVLRTSIAERLVRDAKFDNVRRGATGFHEFRMLDRLGCPIGPDVGRALLRVAGYENVGCYARGVFIARPPAERAPAEPVTA